MKVQKLVMYILVMTCVILGLGQNANAQMNLNWTVPTPEQVGDTFTQKMTVLADPANTNGGWTWHHQLGTNQGDVIYVGPQYFSKTKTFFFSFTAKDRLAYTNPRFTAESGFQGKSTFVDCDGTPGPCLSLAISSSSNAWKVGNEYEYKVTINGSKNATKADIEDVEVKFYVRNLTDDLSAQYTGIPTPWQTSGTLNFERTRKQNDPALLMRWGVNVNENPGDGANGCNPKGSGSIVRIGKPTISLGANRWQPALGNTTVGTYCFTVDLKKPNRILSKTSPDKQFQVRQYFDWFVTIACGDDGTAFKDNDADISCTWDDNTIGPKLAINNVLPQNCKQWLQFVPEKLGNSGTYPIWRSNSEGWLDYIYVYCDFLDYVGSGYGIGNGWTLVANQANNGNWMNADTNLVPGSSYGTYSKDWDKNTSYYLDHTYIAGSANRNLLFRTGNMKQWCAAKASELLQSNSDLNALLVTLLGGFPLNAPVKVNSLNRNTNPEDPWIGCAGTHQQNDIGMFWGENGSNGHLNLKNTQGGIGVFVREP